MAVHQAIQRQIQPEQMAALVAVHSKIPQGLDAQGQDPLLTGLRALCSKLEPRLSALLRDLCDAGQEVQEMLLLDPATEMMAVLDVLEPVEAR